jgi:hypothetical protein
MEGVEQNNCHFYKRKDLHVAPSGPESDALIHDDKCKRDIKMWLFPAT